MRMPDDGAAATRVPLPAERGGRLHRDARGDLRAGARCRGTPGLCCSNSSHDGMLTTRASTPSALSCSYAGNAQRHLAAGGQQQDVGLPVWRIGQDVRPARHARRGRVHAAVERGQRLRDENEHDRLVLQRHDDAPRLDHLVRVGRAAARSGPGIARSEASCSIGWWVGPSSPTPMRVVREDVDDRQLHERGEPDRRLARSR